MDNIKKTKAEIIKDNAELQGDNKVLQDENAALRDKFSELETAVNDRIEAMQDQLIQSAAEGAPVEPEVKMIRDPYAQLHPHKIISHPEGKILSWKGEAYRAKRGWRGWSAVQHDDEIGRELSKYLADPPTKMEGTDERDNYVRRGDSILSWIDEDIWNARQQARTDKDRQRTGAVTDSRNRQLMPGVTTFGEGVKTDLIPKKGL